MRCRALSLLVALALAAPLIALGCRGQASEKQSMLAAAASLRNALPALISAHASKHPGAKISATYGASGDLQKQVEGGAPIDGVIFANARPVDALVEKGLADAGTRKVLATNTLVLIGPKGGEPLTFATIDAVPAAEKIAIGDPGAVPAGQYAKAALQKLGKWEAIQGRLVFGGDVAAVLAYARRGEVAAAVVYRTEIQGVSDVALLDEAKGDWVPRVEVVAAAVKDAKAASEANAFLDFVLSPEGQRVLADFGFGPP